MVSHPGGQPRRSKPTKIARAEATMHGLRASWKPHVYRDIEIESDQSLFELAHVITKAFGFDFEHAFGFFNRLTGRVFSSPVRYELFEDEEAGGEARNVHQATIAQAFPRKNSKMLFVYDYGDEWRFRVEVRDISKPPPDSAVPRVTAEVGKAPEQYPVATDDN
jgi:hypothetical protein